MTSVREFGQLMANLDDGLADGKLTGDEISQIRREGYEAIQAIYSLLHSIGHV
jgi:hypothetical protein